ncbi:MAG: hypothetical protein Q9165_004906 [Trypethelium subeluteriae]
MAQNSEHGLLEIAPDGDVILLVGQGAAQKNLRVHSVALKMASKVFAAMFGPRFAEGQSLSSANPKMVPLPEDDLEALTILCHIIHLRNDVLNNMERPGPALIHESRLWLLSNPDFYNPLHYVQVLYVQQPMVTLQAIFKAIK